VSERLGSKATVSPGQHPSAHIRTRQSRRSQWSGDDQGFARPERGESRPNLFIKSNRYIGSKIVF
jgi:hypothetical protein